MLAAATAHAAEPWIGRWAVDPTACSLFGKTAATSPLIVTSYAVRWFTDVCRIGTMYKTGGAVHIEGLCAGEGGTRSIPFMLQPKGDRLLVKWNRNFSGEMQRCP